MSQLLAELLAAEHGHHYRTFTDRGGQTVHQCECGWELRVAGSHRGDWWDHVTRTIAEEAEDV